MASKAKSSRFENGKKRSGRKKAAVLMAGGAAFAVSGLVLEHGSSAPTPLNSVLSAAHVQQQGAQANHANHDPHPHPHPQPHPHPHPHPGHLSGSHQPHPHPHPHPHP